MGSGYFDYVHDPPLTIDLRSQEQRHGALVADAVLADGTSAAVEAYLVRPSGGPTRAVVMFLHWFAPEAPDGNRTQFLAEAAALTELGVVSLLPQQAFPWGAEPSGADADARRIVEQVVELRRSLDFLVDAEGLSPGRVAVVGHDFGGMYAAVLGSIEPRPAATVIVAATGRWGDWFLPFWSVAGDRHEYLRALAPLDPIAHVDHIAPSPVLFQFARNDYFIAPMTGHEFHAASMDPREIKSYDADHAMRTDDAVADRREFLLERLGLRETAGST